MTQPAVRIGIDENGLGPRLGPLVVTAVVARVDGDGHRRVDRRPRGALGARLGDSKRLVAHGDTGLGEAWARAIVRRSLSRGDDPRAAHGLGVGATAEPGDPASLVHHLSLDTLEALRAPCPDAHASQCWDTSGEAFVADAALVDTVGRDLAKLEAQGIAVLYARSIVTCTRRLNEGVGRGLSRFHLDLHAMERLALDARRCAGVDIVATCGKVGGFDRYSAAFGPLSGHLHAIAEEGRARSEYRVPGLGTLAFVRDAEDKHLLVGMASLVGKWIRDLLMARIVRYHRADSADLPDASGYHDPVTTRFVEATRLSRRKRALPDDCFERRACGEEAGNGARSLERTERTDPARPAPRLTSKKRATPRASGASRPSSA